MPTRPEDTMTVVDLKKTEKKSLITRRKPDMGDETINRNS